jgi:hypothetical protein
VHVADHLAAFDWLDPRNTGGDQRSRRLQTGYRDGDSDKGDDAQSGPDQALDLPLPEYCGVSLYIHKVIGGAIMVASNPIVRWPFVRLAEGVG